MLVTFDRNHVTGERTQVDRSRRDRVARGGEVRRRPFPAYQERCLLNEEIDERRRERIVIRKEKDASSGFDDPGTSRDLGRVPGGFDGKCYGGQHALLEGNRRNVDLFGSG